MRRALSALWLVLRTRGLRRTGSGAALATLATTALPEWLQRGLLPLLAMRARGEIIEHEGSRWRTRAVARHACAPGRSAVLSALAKSGPPAPVAGLLEEWAMRLLGPDMARYQRLDFSARLHLSVSLIFLARGAGLSERTVRTLVVWAHVPPSERADEAVSVRARTATESLLASQTLPWETVESVYRVQCGTVNWNWLGGAVCRHPGLDRAAARRLATDPAFARGRTDLALLPVEHWSDPMVARAILEASDLRPYIAERLLAAVPDSMVMEVWTALAPEVQERILFAPSLHALRRRLPPLLLAPYFSGDEATRVRALSALATMAPA